MSEWYGWISWAVALFMAYMGNTVECAIYSVGAIIVWTIGESRK